MHIKTLFQTGKTTKNNNYLENYEDDWYDKNELNKHKNWDENKQGENDQDNNCGDEY